MRRSPASRLAGFTLVELLVVIGIITVLVALLLPVVVGARQQAYQVKCATNLRAIGQAMIVYVQDSGHYPTAMYMGHSQAFRYAACWPVQVRRAMRGGMGAFHCPARPAEWAWEKRFGPPGQVVGTYPDGDVYAGVLETTIGYELGERLVNDWGPYRFSYGYNSNPSRGLGYDIIVTPGAGGIPQILSRHWRTRRASKVRRPTETIAIADSWGGFFLGSPMSVSDVHRGGVNVVFCDGHVQWYRRNEIGGQDIMAPHVRRMWHFDNQP